MKTTNLGYPRIGNKRELKKALDNYWSRKDSLETLLDTAKEIRKENWLLQKKKGIDIIPSNDFSLYDQVLDTCITLGCIPERYTKLLTNDKFSKHDLYFAMARGIQRDSLDITAMEMTKWFDTNYHYIVPEFIKNQNFTLSSSKIINEYKEALALGIKTKPVLIGPVSFLLLGKEKEEGFNRLDLLENILPLYLTIIQQLSDLEVEYIQFDEPYLAMDLSSKEQEAITRTYNKIATNFPKLKVILANYFDCFGENLETVLALPVHTLHLDLVRCPLQLDDILESKKLNEYTHLSLGVIDGRNVWKNNFEQSIALIQKAVNVIGKDRILLAPSCSLLHSPCDLELETNEKNLSSDIKQWLAFAKQKLEEVNTLKQILSKENLAAAIESFKANTYANENRKTSSLIHNNEVKKRVSELTSKDDQRINPFSVRQPIQKKALNLPLFPTKKSAVGELTIKKEI